MYEIKKVKSKELIPLIQELLEHGGKAWITVTGMSMYPFLRENLDSVELATASFEGVKRGDIVLIRRASGEYVLHRVLKKESDVFYIIGDAQEWIEGPLKKEQLVAKVDSIKRNGQLINYNSKILKLLTKVWLGVIPMRHIILRGIRLVSKINRRIVKVRIG